mmetsp:Transcript_25048/g.73317  ORF Transcript_25048/g.73317 Transcript_25048/m.73317 type:complete len:203 (-) Transcript_25048:688-1296(-)
MTASMAPPSDLTRLMAELTASSSVTSTPSYTFHLPTSLVSSGLVERQRTMAVAPMATSSLVMARPSPRFPPVTRTRFPERSPPSYTESMSRKRSLLSALALAKRATWSAMEWVPPRVSSKSSADMARLEDFAAKRGTADVGVIQASTRAVVAAARARVRQMLRPQTIFVFNFDLVDCQAQRSRCGVCASVPLHLHLFGASAP